jgi:hypothetical protein
MRGGSAPVIILDKNCHFFSNKLEVFGQMFLQV